MQDPNKPLDDGNIGLPSVVPGMNKIAPNDLHDPNDKVRPLRQEYANQAEKDAEILARARKRLDRCIAAEAENRRDGLDDDRFYSGDQWTPEARSRRNAERRPCHTVNRLPVLIKQVTNDQRQNRPTIDIHPVGDRGDINVAKIYRGMIRNIERESHADQAYDTGFESAARKGWGYWRVTTDYETPDTFDQVLRINRIRNPYSVYIDPGVMEIDASDMKFAFITEMIERDEFKAQWPDADPMPWVTGGFGDVMNNWITQHSVRIAEYYEIKMEPRELVLLENGFEGWRDEIKSEILQQFKIIDKRRSMVPKITWYKMTAKEILERTPWLGHWVPIVRCIGDELDLEGKVKLWGLVRQAKDPQRMLNYLRSAEIERILLVPKSPYIIAEGQIEGYEGIWKESNNKSYPYLPYKVTEIRGHLVPPPQRAQPVEVSAGIVNAATEASQDMLATTGIRFDATLNERTYDESGKALRELRRSGDIGSFNLVDNLHHSLRHTGEILVDLIPKIYKRPGRVLTILREDDTEEQIQVAPNSQQPVSEYRNATTQQIMRAFDPGYGHYGVTVTIGPSYATRRIETAESMMDFLRAIPQAAPLIADLVAKNQDWEGAEEIAIRLAKTLPPGLNAPELRDIPPQVQALLTQLQMQLQQLSQERQQLQSALNDRNADRELARERINRTFEVQLLGIVQKAHAAASKIASEDKHEESRALQGLASDVLGLYGQLTKASGEDQSKSITPDLSQAKQAPDGFHYVPDPSRSGKYLRVEPAQANA